MSHSSEAEQFPFIAKLASLIGMPVCIMDTESTGFLSATTGIVEFGCMTIDQHGMIISECIRTHPGVSIPARASEVHGIFDHDVAGCADFKSIADLISHLYRTHVVSGFNTRSYDVPLITRNFARYNLAEILPIKQLDVRDMWITETGSQKGKLDFVAETYGVQAGTAHSAIGDVLTTARILNAMIELGGFDLAMSQLVEGDGKASKIKPGKPSEDKVKSRIKTAILTYVDRFNYIGPLDCEEISARLGCALSSVSFCLTDLMKSNCVSSEQVADKDAQALIAPHMDCVLEMAKEGKLKPIKTYLDSVTGECFDYAQVLAAVDIGRSKAALKIRL